LGGAAAATFGDRNVGVGKSVTVSGYALGGADAGNYSLVGPQGLKATISPATLLYVAATEVRSAGASLDDLGGAVTGFVPGDNLANATLGAAAFRASVPVGTPAGTYGVTGSGLTAGNYVFLQAATNAQALSIIDLAPQATAVVSVDKPGASVVPVVALAVERSMADSGVVIDSSIAAPSPAPAPSPDPASSTASSASGGSESSSQAAAPAPAGAPAPADKPGASFGAVRLASLTAGEIQSLLANRRLMMQNLFADAVQQLEKNPKLADLRGCESVADAQQGGCLVTAKVKAEMAAQSGDPAAVPPAVSGPAPAPAPKPVLPGAPPAVVPGAQDPLLAAAAPPVAAPPPPTPPLKIAPRKVRSAALPQIERKIALVIGVDRYSDASIPSLSNAVNDAQAIAKVFEKRLGYQAVVIDNATKPAIVAAFNQLALTLGPRDSVIVYYAGHGELVETTKLGYWLLSDSVAKQPETWLSNTDISRLIGQMGASQVALISDSCYSGSLASEERIRALTATLDPKAVLDKKSVVVMSSGGNEPVFDDGQNGHSPFAWNLMKSLEQLTNWQAGGNVFEKVRFAVARKLPQRPQYSASRAAGHQTGGDYLFEQRELDAPTP
jgi:hypothetical protein